MPKNIYEAVETQDWEQAQQAIRNGCKINTKKYYGWTPLHLAVSAGYTSQWIELLLAHGADPNSRSDNWSEYHCTPLGTGFANKLQCYREATPFHYVQSIEHAQLLLDAGAAINATDGHYCTLLDHAIYASNKPLVEFLLRSGAEFKVGQVRRFVKLGININEQDEKGRTLLHRAIIWGDRCSAKFLLRSGADVNIIDKFGMSPLQTALPLQTPVKSRNHLNIVKLMVEYGNDHFPAKIREILTECIKDGNVAGVRILKKYGAKITPELLKIEYIDDEMEQLLRGFLAEGE